MSVSMSAEEFHLCVRNHELVVIFFADEDVSDLLTKAKSIVSGNAFCAQINSTKHPELVEMFGFGQQSSLLIMREQIVLYAEDCVPSFDALETLLERAQALDMKAVRDKMEAQRAAEALEIRNVCFTARRRTASN